MEWWVGVAGLLLSLIISLIAIVRSYSEDLGERRAWREIVEKTLNRHSEQHQDHYRHSSNADMHWTAREREALTGQLDRIEELIRESMMPRSNWRHHQKDEDD